MTSLASPDTIGIDLGGTKLLLLCGEAEQRSETGPDFAPADLVVRLRAFATSHGLRPRAMGIAVPALVDAGGRVGACDVLPRFSGWDAATDLAGLADRVVVINDVKAALAEEMHDAPPGITAGVIMAGTAIGAAFVAHGRPLLGARGWAGELGYLPLMTGPGHRVQRLDELAGGSFIAASLGFSADELARRAEAGDAPTLTAIHSGGHALGLGIAGVINLLNPARLALGGGALRLPGYRAAAYAAAQEHSLPDLWAACSLTDVRAGDRVAALGAARLASS